MGSILNEIDHIPIKIASPEKILEWSYGEVTKPETINYRTLRPEPDGLFCERIFGPVRDYECASYCGHLKKDEHRHKVCEKCGVQATHSKVRRERMGHIKLEEPVAHFWFFKGKESYISIILDIPKNDLMKIIYCDSRIVIDPGDTPLAYKQLLTETEYIKALEEYTPENGFKKPFKTGIGASVIRDMLKEIDVEDLYEELKERLKTTKSKQERKRIEKRMKVAASFIESGNKPEWMVLTVIPVLPPELRPMVQIDGGRFASSDLNELYRNVINRNNRLKKLKSMDAPNILIENGMRLLQDAVDMLIDNAHTKRKLTGPGGRPLKSLTDQLKGKQGRFRQNLLGKRVDYSGRSVIVSGPELRIHQVGIPRKMAVELFRPFVIREMIRKNKAVNLKNAKYKIDMGHKDVWGVLEEVVKHHPVLLNRAPTLHKLSIRAFEVVLVEGKAIRLHPLVCGGFNADFDGDQMAVHVPISNKAQLEARMLMLSTENLIHPQNGKPTNTPSQDMVLGCYYLSIEKDGKKGESKYFATPREVIKAYEKGWVDLHAKIILNVSDNEKIKGYKYIVTTPGKVIFNEEMPKRLPYINDIEISKTPKGVFNDIGQIEKMVKASNNKSFDKGFIGDLIDYALDKLEKNEMVDMLDSLMDLGFKFAMRGGLTISAFDIETPESKEKDIREAEKEVEIIERRYDYGFITDEYRYKQTVKIWSEMSDKLGKDAYERLIEKKDENHISMMVISGARGNKSQYAQLAANRGLMLGPDGKIIDSPIKSNFTEGLTVDEYFTSTHGSRKGMVDTALKTADSGYLTRRLVDVAQDVVITEEDCGTDEYFELEAIEPGISLGERVYGRFLMEDVYDNEGNLIAEKGEMVNKEQANRINEVRKSVKIRNVLTCEAEDGLCSKCYGMDLASRKPVVVGEAVGIIAAQSIGEPGTQLTMRTFHTGGVAGVGDITQGLPRVEQIFEARKLTDTKDRKSILTERSGTVTIREKGMIKEVTVVDDDGEFSKYHIPNGYGLLVKDGEKVEKGDSLTTGPINPHELLKLKDIHTVRKYIIEEIQKVYKSQGVTISDKHVEIIARQMTKKVTIKHPGDSNLIVGRLEDRNRVLKLNEKLRKEGKREIEYRDKVQSITNASLTVDSFLSSSSFERTSLILPEAAIRGKRDYIKGLKESVILGKLIPAGTGFYEYKKMEGKTKK